MADVVAVAAPLLLDDHLGVPDDEAAEQQEAAPEIDLFYWVEMSFMKSLVFFVKFDKNLKLKKTANVGLKIAGNQIMNKG